MRLALQADTSTVGAMNRPLLLCQVSFDGWATWHPQGVPLHFLSQMKLDGLLQVIWKNGEPFFFFCCSCSFRRPGLSRRDIADQILALYPHVEHAGEGDESHRDREDHQAIETAEVYEEPAQCGTD